MAETEQVRRAQAGDVAAFEALASSSAGPLYASAWALVGDRHDAEDLCQEAWILAHRSLHQLRNPDAFRPWLHSILRNLAHRFRRGRWRHPAEPLERHADASVEDGPELIERRERFAQLWEAVREMDDRSREALLLHYGEGLSIRETAELLGASEAAVKMRLARARRRLAVDAEHLKETWALAPAPGLPEATLAAVSASPFLAVFVGWSAFIGWFFGRDAEQWRGFAPDVTITRSKWFIFACALFFPLFFGTLALLKAYELSVLWALAVFLPLPVFGCYIGWREMTLFQSRRQIWMTNTFLVFIAGSIVAQLLWPKIGLLMLGLTFVLIGVWTNVSEAPRAARESLPFVVWLPHFLRMTSVADTTDACPTDEDAARAWFRVMHRLGLASGPLDREPGQWRVTLPDSRTAMAYVPWVPRSSMAVDRDGRVQCRIAPSTFDLLRDDLPQLQHWTRRKLDAHLSDLFTQSYRASRESEEAAVAALNRGALPESKSNMLFWQMNFLPILGAIVIIAALADLMGLG